MVFNLATPETFSLENFLLLNDRVLLEPLLVEKTLDSIDGQGVMSVKVQPDRKSKQDRLALVQVLVVRLDEVLWIWLEGWFKVLAGKAEKKAEVSIT